MKTKNLIKSIFFTIIGIFLFQTSFCQENYLPGYIIQLKGDTLHGFIDYRNWAKNPNKISFKKKMTDIRTIYKPIDIKAFSVLDEIYESAIVKTEISPEYTNDLLPKAELLIRIDTTFLQTIIKGSQNLYYYINEFDKNQFYTKQDSVYEFLIYKKYLKNQKNNTIIAENNNYIGQLTIYLQDCPTIQAKIKSTKYTIKDMKNLFSIYNECKGAKNNFQRKVPILHPELGVLAGLSISNIKFGSQISNFDYLTKSKYKSSLDFSAGLYLDLIIPRNRGKLSICNELLFASFKTSGRYNYYVSVNKYTNTYTKLEYSYLKLNNLLRYRFLSGEVECYLNAGLSNNFVISETNYMKQESKLFTMENVVEGRAISFTRKYEWGYVFGLGSKIKKYSFEFRYECGNGMSDLSNLSSQSKRYFFLFGYRF